MHQQFDETIFIDRGLLVEDGLLDYKVQLPIIIGDARKLAEIIYDVIALANTARSCGKEAYLAFGVADDRTLVGIQNQGIWKKEQKDWNNLSIEKQCERIQRDLIKTVSEYIVPPLSGLEYYYGICKDVLVSYLQILPLPTKEPFETGKNLVEVIEEDNPLSKAVKTPINIFTKGVCWQRRGESKYQVKETEKSQLYSFRDVPFIHNSAWQKYTRKASPPPSNQIQPEHVITLMTSDRQNLMQVVKEFVDAPDKPLLVIEGDAGAGKTTFLLDVRREFASIAYTELQKSPFNHTIIERIPIYYDLNFHLEKGLLLRNLAINPDALSINELIEYDFPSLPERIFANRNLNFLILLDALDEIEEGDVNWRQTTQTIQTMTESQLNFKVIITSRPETLPPDWRKRYQSVQIAPLFEDQIYQIMALSLLRPRAALTYLFSSEETSRLIKTPLMLTPIIEYWRDLEKRQEEEQNNYSQDRNSMVIKQAPTGMITQIIEPEEDILFSQFLPPLEPIKIPQDETLIKRVENLPSLIKSNLVEPQLGKLIDKVYNALLKHDEGKGRNRRVKETQDERKIALGALAAYLDGKTNETTLKMAKLYLKDDIYYWALNLGILQYSYLDVHLIGFGNRFSKLYFATLYLQTLVQGGEWEVIKSLQRAKFWVECLELFEDLNFFGDSLPKLRYHLQPRWSDVISRVFELLLSIARKFKKTTIVTA